MAKRRRNTKKKKDSTFWQWIWVALIAIVLYKGLDYFLPRGPRGPQPEPTKQTTSAEKPKATPTPSPTPEIQKVKMWTEENAHGFLPEDGFADNYQVIPLKQKENALLAYARTLPGKNPGPMGSVNTRPGLRLLKWDGKEYQKLDLPFSELGSSLGNLSTKKFVGLPQLETKSLDVEGVEIFPAKIFLTGDDRVVTAFLLVNDKGLQWAPLGHASGKKMDAAFVTGTTKDTTQNVRIVNLNGKEYIILESGKLDENRPYAGYQWNVQAYFWNGEKFAFDKEYSQELAKKKKLNP